MILSDREIIAALKRGLVKIVPEPDPSDPDIWSSTALDLRLDGKLEVWKQQGAAGARGARRRG